MPFNDFPQINLRTTSVRAVRGYPTIALCGEIIIGVANPGDVNKTATANGISVGNFMDLFSDVFPV